jgi:YVTN family beta-propeller protein
VATIPVGRRPLSVGVSDERGAFAYVANSADDSVSIVDLGTRAVVKTLPVGDSPTTVAVARIRATAAPQPGARVGSSAVPRDLPNTGVRAAASVLPGLLLAGAAAAAALARR